MQEGRGFSNRPCFRELETRPNLHLPAREAPKDQNKHVQIRAPEPSSISSEQEQTYTNSHPLVEDAPAEDLLAARGANSGRFGARRLFAMLYWSRPDLDQSAQGVVHHFIKPCYQREDASQGAHCVCRHLLFTRRAMLSR